MARRLLSLSLLLLLCAHHSVAITEYHHMYGFALYERKPVDLTRWYADDRPRGALGLPKHANVIADEVCVTPHWHAGGLCLTVDGAAPHCVGAPAAFRLTSTQPQTIVVNTTAVECVQCEAAPTRLRFLPRPTASCDGRKRKVIDVTLISHESELPLLELRLLELADVVDLHIVIEAPTTFTNHPRPLLKAQILTRFAQFAHKILVYESNTTADYQWMSAGTPADQWPWIAEALQRNAALHALERGSMSAQDIVLMMDMDELPRPSVVKMMAECSDSFLFPVYLHMDHYMYSVNWKVTDPWRHPYAVLGSLLTHALPSSPTWAATPHGIRIYGGIWCSAPHPLGWPSSALQSAGWHLSWFMQPPAIAEKLAAFAHAELNTPRFQDTAQLACFVAAGLRMMPTGALMPLEHVAWFQGTSLTSGAAQLPNVLVSHRQKFASMFSHSVQYLTSPFPTTCDHIPSSSACDTALTAINALIVAYHDIDICSFLQHGTMVVTLSANVLTACSDTPPCVSIVHPTDLAAMAGILLTRVGVLYREGQSLHAALEAIALHVAANPDRIDSEFVLSAVRDWMTAPKLPPPLVFTSHKLKLFSSPAFNEYWHQLPESAHADLQSMPPQCAADCEWAESVDDADAVVLPAFDEFPTASSITDGVFHHSKFGDRRQVLLCLDAWCQLWENSTQLQNVAVVGWSRAFDFWLPFACHLVLPLTYSPSAFRRLHSRARVPAIASFISNCDSPWRQDIIAHLQQVQGLPVHHFGACMHSHNVSDPELSRRAAKLQTLQSYAATFAIENSFVQDYVTEKVFEALAAGAVPVYFGAPNADTVVDPSTIINMWNLTRRDAATGRPVAMEHLDLLADQLLWRMQNEALRASYLQQAPIHIDSPVAQRCADMRWMPNVWPRPFAYGKQAPGGPLASLVADFDQRSLYVCSLCAAARSKFAHKS